MKVNEEIRSKQMEIVDKYHAELVELKNTLKIPRQHFKWIEKMTYDEMVQKRDETINKLRA